MTRAVECVHECGILHLDIKLCNWLVFKGTTSDDHIIKLTDFGLSQELDPAYYMTSAALLVGRCGTLHYMPPEMIQMSNTKLKITRSADIWSLGMCMYVLLHR